MFSIYLSKILVDLAAVANDPSNQDAIDKVNGYSLGFFIIGIISFIFTLIQNGCFGIIGDLITRKIRV